MTNNDYMALLDAEELRKMRRKYWTFVIWPSDVFDEGLTKDYQRYEFRRQITEGLGDMVIPSLISPIHDKDVKDDGMLSKPHCHVVSMWEQPQRYKAVLETIRIGCGFDNVKYVQPVANLRAMMRYLIHLDNPEKVQYDPKDVIEVAGAEYVLEHETASEMVVSAIVDMHIQTMTALMVHFQSSPSCRKWIMANPGFVKTMLKEQVMMTRNDLNEILYI